MSNHKSVTGRCPVQAVSSSTAAETRAYVADDRTGSRLDRTADHGADAGSGDTCGAAFRDRAPVPRAVGACFAGE
jgi:hypothetical protein